MAKINIEFDVLGDCSDKIIVYPMDFNPEDNVSDAYYRSKTNFKNIEIIQAVCKPKAIVRVMKPDYIKTMDRESAINFINAQIKDLTKIKDSLSYKYET